MNKIFKYVILIFIISNLFGNNIEINIPSVLLTGISNEIQINVNDSTILPFILHIENQQYHIKKINKKINHIFEKSGKHSIKLEKKESNMIIKKLIVIPGLISILPPLIAILMALLTKQVIPSLFLGIWIGAWSINGFTIKNIFIGLFRTFDTYIIQSLVPPDGGSGHASIIMFSMMLGGMIGIITKNGGAMGIVNLITKWSNNSSRGQLSASIFGTVFFIDDYANTLIVGNTIKPLTDKLRISREKLAYIVDSTAAPVACIALISTWIGYEVGLIGESLPQLNLESQSPYGIFLHSIKYSFYPILALFFVYLISITRKDFGPMWEFEQNARKLEKNNNNEIELDSDEKNMLPKNNVNAKALNAFIPIILVILTTIYGLFITGEGETFQDIIGSADSYSALLWASLVGVLSAILLSIFQRILSLKESMDAWYSGVRSMLYTMIILLLAWALSNTTEVLRTADYFVSLLGDKIHPGFLPVIIFIISSATSFSTGTSWGTMGILMPLTIPLVGSILYLDGGISEINIHILYASVSAVLCGSVWGDHCSPISDTTILSSIASGCDHINHVKSQIPYALVVGGVSIIFGLIPIGFGAPWWLCLIISCIILTVILNLIGKETKNYSIN